MALNRPVPWLIAYDIRDPKRLSRLHRFLRRRAVPVQYSVFALRASYGQIGMLARDIEARIDLRVDDVRIYRIPEPAKATTWGRAILPNGLLLHDSSGELIPTPHPGTVNSGEPTEGSRAADTGSDQRPAEAAGEVAERDPER